MAPVIIKKLRTSIKYIILLARWLLIEITIRFVKTMNYFAKFQKRFVYLGIRLAAIINPLKNHQQRRSVQKLSRGFREHFSIQIKKITILFLRAFAVLLSGDDF